MLNRETNTDILGMYRKTSENVLKFSYFGEVQNNVTKLHSLPPAYSHASENAMLLHSGSTGIGTDITVTEISNVNISSALIFKQFTSIAAMPNYIKLVEPFPASISTDKLTDIDNGLHYSLLVKIANPTALTDSDALMILNTRPDNSITIIQGGSAILSSFVHLGNNVYALNDNTQLAYFSSDTGVVLPKIALASLDSGTAAPEASTTIEYLDACIIANAK